MDMNQPWSYMYSPSLSPLPPPSPPDSSGSSQCTRPDTDVQNRLLDSVGEGKGGMFRENSIETCILSRVKEITSPGWMHETSASHILISDAPWILWMYTVWSEDWSFAFLTNPQVMPVVLVLTALGVLELSENTVLGCGRNGGADTSTRTLELPLLRHSPLL